MKRLLMVLLFMMMAAQIIRSQDDSLSFNFDDIMDIVDEPSLNMKLFGDHYFQYHLPMQEGNYSTFIKAPKFINKFGLDIEKGDIELHSEWEVRGVLNETGEWNELSEARIGENYIKWKQERINIGFGYQDYSWGVADEFNPTNNLNPKDYEKGYEIDDIPILSASIRFYPNESFSFEGVFIPFEQSDKYFFDFEDEIPSELFSEFRFTGYDLQTNRPVVGLLSNTSKTNFDYLKFSPKSSLLGIKANYFSTDLDLSLSYVYDIDPFYTPVLDFEEYTIGVDKSVETRLNEEYSPEKAAEIINQLSNQKTYRVSKIDLTRRRIHRLGFDAKTIIDKYGIWLEACYSITEDKSNNSYKLRNDDLSWTAGLDFNYGPNDRFYVNLQYTGKWISKYDDKFFTDYQNGMPSLDQVSNPNYMEEYYYRSIVQPLGIQTERVTHGILAQFEWSFYNETLKPVINAYYTIPSGYDGKQKKRYGSLMLNPELEYMPGSSIHFKLGSYLAYSWYKPVGSNEIKNNDRSDLIGYLYPFNNIYLKVTYEWNINFEK